MVRGDMARRLSERVRQPPVWMWYGGLFLDDLLAAEDVESGGKVVEIRGVAYAKAIEVVDLVVVELSVSEDAVDAVVA